MWRKVVFCLSMAVLTIDLLRRPVMEVAEHWDIFCASFNSIVWSESSITTNGNWEGFVFFLGGAIGIVTIMISIILLIVASIGTLGALPHIVVFLFSNTIGRFYCWAFPSEKQDKRCQNSEYLSNQL